MNFSLVLTKTNVIQGQVCFFFWDFCVIFDYIFIRIEMVCSELVHNLDLKAKIKLSFLNIL